MVNRFPDPGKGFTLNMPAKRRRATLASAPSRNSRPELIADDGQSTFFTAGGVGSWSIQNNEGGGHAILSVTITGTAAGSSSLTGLIDNPLRRLRHQLDRSLLRSHRPCKVTPSGLNFSESTVLLAGPITPASTTPEPATFGSV